MKKLIFSALSIVLLAGGMASCGKSTKGKMSNDWKVDSYETKTVDTDSNGDQTTTTTTMSGSTVTVKTEDASGGSSTTTTQNGTLTSATFKIEKDGTWKMDRNYYFTTSPSTGVSNTTTMVESESGTWSFIGKNKEEDFKKNERVLFNTLTSSSSSTSVTSIGSNSSTSTSSSSETYKAGDRSMIYVVTESKGKELELTTDSGTTSTTSGGTTSSTTTSKINLVEQ